MCTDTTDLFICSEANSVSFCPKPGKNCCYLKVFSVCAEVTNNLITVCVVAADDCGLLDNRWQLMGLALCFDCHRCLLRSALLESGIPLRHQELERQHSDGCECSGTVCVCQCGWLDDVHPNSPSCTDLGRGPSIQCCDRC